MFEFITDEDERGQVGIGTLIVFIAMVLVAAIAAGVLINTAGFLQTKSEATGQESTSQVSNRITVISSYGTVNYGFDSDDPTNDTADNIANGTIEWVDLTVMRSAGSDDINLSRSTVEWIGPDRAVTLLHNGTTDANANRTDFITKQIQGDSALVLEDQETRIDVRINAVKVANNRNDLNVSGTTYSGLSAGDEVKLRITTQYGATTTYYLSVPESLEGKNVVQL